MASRHVRVSGRGAAGRGRERFGRSFSVDDALLALRWAELVRSRGYRLAFSHGFVRADEVIQVHLPPLRTTIASIWLGTHRVWVADCVGQATPHESLAAALGSLVVLSRHESQVLLTPRTPSWLWTFQPRVPVPANTGRVRTLANLVSRWLTGLLAS